MYIRDPQVQMAIGLFKMFERCRGRLKCSELQAFKLSSISETVSVDEIVRTLSI